MPSRPARPATLPGHLYAQTSAEIKISSPVSGATGLRGRWRSPQPGCPKLLRRPGQLTRSDGVRQSNPIVWSGFRPDMNEDAWQRPSLVRVGRSFPRYPLKMATAIAMKGASTMAVPSARSQISRLVWGSISAQRSRAWIVPPGNAPRAAGLSCGSRSALKTVGPVRPVVQLQPLYGRPRSARRTELRRRHSALAGPTALPL
jgi:hypothetical protein